MSFEAINWAWQVETRSPTVKLVLMGLANYADQNHACYPSRKALAKHVGISVKSVQRITTELAELGYITKQKRTRDDGSLSSNLYVLNVGFSPACSGDNLSHDGDINAHCRVHQGTHVTHTDDPRMGTSVHRGDGTSVHPHEPSVITTSRTTSVIKPQTPQAGRVSQKSTSDVSAVFEHWKQVMQKGGRTILDAKRKRAITARLKDGYTVDELKAAIEGCAATPHNMGQNQHKKRYDDIELICRNASNVDRFIQNGSEHRRNDADMDDFLGESGSGNVIDGEWEVTA